MFVCVKKKKKNLAVACEQVNEADAHGGGQVVSASGSETSVWSSTPTSAIIYDAYTSIIYKTKKKSVKQKRSFPSVQVLAIFFDFGASPVNFKGKLIILFWLQSS